MALNIEGPATGAAELAVGITAIRGSPKVSISLASVVGIEY
jgi:hypothetical protein